MAEANWSSNGKVPSWAQYGIALGAVLLATLFGLLLEPLVGLSLPYVTYLLCNALVIRYLWQGPSIAAIVLSSLAADYFFLPPLHTLWSRPEHYITTFIFLLGNFVILRLAQALCGNAQMASERTAVQEGINQVFQKALSCRSEEELGRLCLATAEKVTGSKFGFMGEINPKTGLLDDIAISDPGWEACRMKDVTGHGRKLPSGLPIHGLYGGVLKGGKGFFTNEPPSHPEWIGLPAGHPPLAAFLGVPLLSGGKILGLIAVANRPGGYSGRDLEALESLASAFVQVLMRHRAEEALRESEARLKATFHQAGMGLLETGPNDQLIAVNEHVCKILGYRPEELLTKTLTELTYPADRALTTQLNAELCQGFRERLDYEKRYLKADGSPLWVHVTVAPVRDAQGQTLRSIATVEDISERKEMIEALTKAKEDLRDHSENLERLVEERTAKLRQALGELEHFSYTLSHDMRAPLRAIQGFGAIMMESGCDSCKNSMSKGLLQRMVTGATRMDHMITDALEYSRAARDVLQLTPVDLGQLLRTMLSTHPNLQPLFADVKMKGPFPEVLGNETALTQCFSNLLSNAVKYVAPGVKPRVRIRAESREEDYVRIWVEDNGIGIPKEHQPKLFQMFQRIASKYEGTGIGLALVKKNAERMGGRVGVESEPGQGSRFWLELKQANEEHSLELNA